MRSILSIHNAAARLVWPICVRTILIFSMRPSSIEPGKARQSKNLQRRSDHHRAAAPSRPRLGNFQCQWSRCRNHRHEPAHRRRGDGSGRYRLRCRRRPGIGGRDPHRVAVASDLVFVGSDLLLDSGRAAVQDAARSQRQKDRPLRRRRRHQPCRPDDRAGEDRAPTRKTIRWSPSPASNCRFSIPSNPASSKPR